MILDIAQILVRNLIRRIRQNADGNYELHGPFTPEEVDALRSLSGGQSLIEAPQSAPPQPKAPPNLPRRFGAARPIPVSTGLDTSCLTVEAQEEGDIVAIDFGTAFSKSALWRFGSPTPTPLDLVAQVADGTGNMLESAVYITDGAIHFGPHAELIFRQEDSPDRALFDSPKQELSLLGGDTLQQIADRDVDPSHSLTKRDLLTLYLAYLSAATSAALEAVGADRHTLRRFAVPVWKLEKLAVVTKLLKHLLIDAQILADTLPPNVWRDGLEIGDARRLIDQIRSSIADSSRDAAGLVTKHVVEPAAAVAAIGEKLRNRRPVVLILDVGAGTTDVGLYFFSLPGAGTWKIAPFADCQGALTLAGNELDSRLIQFVRDSASIDPNGADGKRALWALRRDIRDHKSTMFNAGFVDIEELGGRRFNRDEFMASGAVKTFRADLKRQITTLLSKVGKANIDPTDGLFGVVTGGGANVPLFRGLFSEPFQLDDGAVSFKFLDATPEWVDDYTPDIRGIFPQLAVSIGACSPYLPNERRPVTNAAIAPRRVIGSMYTSQ